MRAPVAGRRPEADARRLRTAAGRAAIHAAAVAASISRIETTITSPGRACRVTVWADVSQRNGPTTSPKGQAEEMREVTSSWCHGRGLEKLKSVGACRVRVLLAGEKTRDLAHALFIMDLANLGNRHGTIGGLVDHHM